MITKADADVLTLQLQKMSNGAHSHIAGKARFYLGRIADKPKTGFSNCSADEFVAAVRQAAYHDKWTDLDKLMSRWW